MAKPPASLKEPVLNLSGFSDIDSENREIAEEEAHKTIIKLSKLVNVEELVIDLNIFEKDGKERKYSFHARISTEKGFFTAAAHDWKFLAAYKEVLSRLEREVIETKQKKQDLGKSR